MHHDILLAHAKAGVGGGVLWLVGQVAAVAKGLAPPWSVVPPLLFSVAALLTAIAAYRKNEQTLKLERERHDADLARMRMSTTGTAVGVRIVPDLRRLDPKS